MPVKPMQSGQRMLEALEAVARLQPVGVSDLARATNVEKSTAQRLLATLAAAGWIRQAAGRATKWELTGRIVTVAQQGQGSGALCRRARDVLADLRDATDETVLLALLERDSLLVAEVAESPREWRLVPRVGATVPDRQSASALAIAPFLPAPDRDRLLGVGIDAALEAVLARVRACGYAVQESERGGGSINIGAAILDSAGRPRAAIVLSAPATRLPRERWVAHGEAVAAAALRLSSE